MRETGFLCDYRTGKISKNTQKRLTLTLNMALKSTVSSLRTYGEDTHASIRLHRKASRLMQNRQNVRLVLWLLHSFNHCESLNWNMTRFVGFIDVLAGNSVRSQQQQDSNKILTYNVENPFECKSLLMKNCKNYKSFFSYRKLTNLQWAIMPISNFIMRRKGDP